MTDENFELRLIEALQPVRGFALAQGTYHLFASGIYERLDNSGSTSVEDLSGALGFDPGRTRGFLRFLANEDLVAFDGEQVDLTARGRALREFRPWYELLVGGYASTFQQITSTLEATGYATRNGAMVGIGSCGISAYDALPLVQRLLRRMPERPSLIVDLGCGDGTFLQSLARAYPGVHAVGIDPYAPEEGDDLVQFERASATDYVRSFEGVPSHEADTELFMAAFLLQEILEQEGRDGVVALVRRVLQRKGYFAVVEVDHRPADPTVMRHGLALAYYNPYYLLHVLTEQRLETTEFWLDLFDEAEAVVVAHESVDPHVDSTRLEFGCLLTAK